MDTNQPITSYDDYQELFRGCGVPIKLKSQDDFLKIKETLTRIGIPSKDRQTITQTAHILHKKGCYAILHFKELFTLDGKDATIEISDIARRNKIVTLLNEWGLCDLVFPDEYTVPISDTSQFKIIKNSDKHNWNLVSKYTIGKKYNDESNHTASERNHGYDNERFGV